MILSILIFILVFSMLVLRKSGFHFFGKNAHPISLTILLQIFISTLLGTTGVAAFDFPMGYGMESQISESTKLHALITTYISVAILFLGLALLFNTKILTPLPYRSDDHSVRKLKWLTLISFVILTIKLITVTEIPMVLALLGDVNAAGAAKARILTNKDGVTFFGLNYLFRSFTSYIYLASVMMLSYDSKNSTKRTLFFINLFLALANSLYDIQKYTVVLLCISTFWLFYIRHGRTIYLIRGGLFALVLCICMFVITLGYGIDLDLLINTLQRIFVVQNEGMFYIYEFLKPDSKYIGLGFPLASVLQLEQIDPAAEVVQILFPSESETWVNANTYYIAHAWTMFGNLAIIIGPFFVLLNLVLILRISYPLIKKAPSIYYPIIFWIIIRFPLINIFTDFMWLKIALDAAINLAFVMIFLYIFEKINQKPAKAMSN
jgi:hypothetical protein